MEIHKSIEKLKKTLKKSKINIYIEILQEEDSMMCFFGFIIYDQVAVELMLKKSGKDSFFQTF